MRVEGVGLDDIGAGFEVGAMNCGDHVGAGQHEMIVAAFERGAAEIRSGQIALLDHGAHGPIEDKNPVLERLEKRLLAVVHAAVSIVAG